MMLPRHALALLLLLPLAPVCGGSSAADWTDRGEYDLALTIRAEAAPQKRLQLLDQWKAKYPKTAMRQVRRELYLATYQSLGDNAGMLAVAREMLADQPNNPVGLYWTTLLTPGAKDPSREVLEAGEQGARGLLAASGAPADASSLAHRTLGWIHWQRGEYPAAEEQLTLCLQQAPQDAEASEWLGTVLALEKQPDKQVTGLWHLARAASLRGEGALPERRQRQLSTLLERLYTAYHGDSSGLEQLRAAVAAGPLPPAGFSIESAAAVAARKADEELERTNPQLAAWLRIRKHLEAPDGPQYFDTLRAAPLPRLKGTLISSQPARRPNQLILGVRDSTTPEVTLHLNTALAREPAPGIQIEFEGTPESFAPSPFMIVVAVDRGQLEASLEASAGARPRP